jgi:hypothetical protein
MNARSILFFGALLPAALFAQTGNISGTIVAAVSGEPLAHGVVSLSNIALTAFTSDSGRFGFRDVPVGRYVVSVKRLGFTPREVSVEVRDGVTDSLRIELDHIALTLGSITVHSWPNCTVPGMPADSALATIVQQIRLNAEQFNFLSQEYPFTYNVIIARSSKLRKTGMVAQSMPDAATYSSRVKREYSPGNVIQARGGAFFFRIPTLAEVADPKFIARHCWHYGGTETIDDEDMYRVDIVADDALKGPDVNGSFLVNKSTFQIRRSILHLSKRHPLFKELAGMETTTNFFEVLTSISIPSNVFSVQTSDPERKADWVEAYEEHRTIGFKFIGRKPGQAKP